MRTHFADIPIPGQWVDRARCRGTDPAIFFPISERVPAAASRICSHCTVRRDCFDYALTYPDLKGVWAATSERTRSRLRRQSRQLNLLNTAPHRGRPVDVVPTGHWL